MVRQTVLTALVCAWAGAASGAQVSGFIDVSYSWNLNGPPGPVPTSPLRSYDFEVDTVLLNAAHVAITGELSPDTSYVVEIDFGQDAWKNSIASIPLGIPSYVDLQEAYVDVKAPDTGFGLRAGKFATFAGIEVVESPENPTMSRGLLYNYTVPVTHTGACLTYHDDEFDLAIGGVNGWDIIQDTNAELSLVAKMGFRPARNFELTLVHMNGPEDGAALYDRSFFDATAVVKVNRQATFFLEYNRGSEETPAGDDDEWKGFGLQAVFELSDAFSLGLRYERLDDEDDSRTGLGTPGVYSNLTVAPAFRLSRSTTLRLEVRHDTADWDAFPDDTGPFMKDSQTTVAVEVFTVF